MTKKPLISVIVPVYNQEKFVARCLRSLVNQDFSKEKYEIIVINDGSTDKTAVAMKPFTDSMTLIELSENIGLSGAINKGIGSSKAPYIVRVDSDDFVNEHFLSVLYMFLAENREMDAVACDYLLVNDREDVLERRNCMVEPIACGIMFRTDQLIDIGLYDESFLLHEDRDLRIRFLQKHTITHVQVPLYRYRRHDDNITNNILADEFHKAKLVEKHGNAAH